MIRDAFTAPGPPSYEPGAPPPVLAPVDLAAVGQALDETVTACLMRPSGPDRQW